MENDLAHAKRLEDNLSRRSEFANPETTVAVPSEGRTDATKRARQAEVETPHESADTGGASGSSAEVDVDMRMVHAGIRQLDPGRDKDMVCGLDGCDELDELDELDENSFSDTYVNDRGGDYTDEVTGVTLLRDDVAKARMEEMRWYEQFQAFDEVPDERCVLRTGRKPTVDGETSIKVTANEWNCEVDWSRVRSNRKGPTATSQEHHHWHLCVA